MSRSREFKPAFWRRARHFPRQSATVRGTMKTLFLNSSLIFVLLIAALGAGLGTPASSTEKPGGRSQAASGVQAAAPSQEGSASAKAEDVDTLEHILAAVYDCISGPAGPRDWGRFRS